MIFCPLLGGYVVGFDFGILVLLWFLVIEGLVCGTIFSMLVYDSFGNKWKMI